MNAIAKMPDPVAEPVADLVADGDKLKSRGRKGAAAFWAKLPTKEARSEYMRNRFALAKLRKLNRQARAERARHAKTRTEESNADQAQAVQALFELRILLGDILTLLGACNTDGRAGEARDIFGKQISRSVLLAADSLLRRGITNLNLAGIGVTPK